MLDTPVSSINYREEPCLKQRFSCLLILCCGVILVSSLLIYFLCRISAGCCASAVSAGNVSVEGSDRVTEFHRQSDARETQSTNHGIQL